MFSRASPGLFLTSLTLVLSGIVPSLFSTNHATSVLASPHPQDVAVAALEPLFSRSHIPDSNLFARAGDSSLAKRDPLGSCGAVGPFPGDVDPSVTVVCLPQRRVSCRATDLTGCQPGDATNVVSLVVSNFDTRQEIGGSASVVDAPFICPDTGRAKCTLKLSGPNFGEQYGLRAVYV